MEEYTDLVSHLLKKYYAVVAVIIVTTGKVFNGQGASIPAELVPLPKVVDLATAASYHLALTENGDVFYWGKYQVTYIYLFF